MHKNTLLEIFRSFSNEEISAFDDFLRSPYHNRNSNVIRLFMHIKAYSPGYEDAGLNKEHLWKRIFPDKNYNYGVMKNLVYELKRLASRFIMLKELENNKLEEETLLVRAMGVRDLSKSFANKIGEIERKYRNAEFSQLNIAAEDYYDQMFRLLWMKHSYMRVSNPKMSTDKDFEAYTTLTVCAFLSYVFKFHSNLMTLSLDRNYDRVNNVVATLMDILKGENMDILLNSIKASSERDYSIFKLLLLKTISVSKEAVPSDFFDFRSELYSQIDKFNGHDIKGFLISLINSANRLNSPQINLNRERTETLKTMMRKNILTHSDGTIYLLELLMYFWSAGDVNEFDLIETLITRYVVRSNDEKKDNVLECGRIFLHIRDGNFEEALNSISKVTPESFMMKVRLRMLRARCLYALNDYESFRYERDSLNHFIKSSGKLNRIHADKLKEVFDKINRLFRLRQDFDESEFALLKIDVQANENYPEWIKQAVSELQGKNRI